ncbi:uncharacterized protein LOC141703399 isoform X2 [Apium graveolens]|uniref:uncharacterized protein LOC141703399 isoform X2 n=1 Tax=Apium graveolens TaxID=4045 RepID=UPI003D7B7A97
MENEQQQQQYVTTNHDDGHSLLLKLSENDPLFHKKKKLLQLLGISPDECIHLKAPYTAVVLNSVLDQLLQKARIMTFNEVDLYFDATDVIQLVKFNNPRNELEALHSVLLLIDNSILSAKHLRVDVLQDLREMILDKINALGNKIRQDTVLAQNVSCDKETCLLQWGEGAGVQTKLDIAYVEGAGRGAIARENLKAGDIALEIPVTVIISEEAVHKSDMFPILEKFEGITSETMLLLWSMKEKHNRDSNFKFYFDALPAVFNTGLSFGVDALLELDGTLLLEEIVQAKEHLRSQYDELFPALYHDHPDIFPPDLYTWEHFLWACELWYSNSMKVVFPDERFQTCLVPVAGFLNHSDDGTTTSWTLLEEFSLIHVGLSSVSQQAAKEINEDNVPLVEETARMKKARLAGLDTRGKATEPIFLKKHKEPMGEASTEGVGGHSAPITAAAPTATATGAFQPLWGFRRGDTVVGSTKHAWDWSYHSVTPKDFTDVVATPDLERIKLMGAQSMASSNAYFQGAVRQAESWKRASDKADNALRRQQKKYATLEKKLKRKEEELGESNAELVVLRAEKDKAIDNYLDSEEFAQSMRIRDDSVFPGFFRTGWDTALGTVNEACPDINPTDYVCPDDEALLQRFRTRVVVSDHVSQDPLLPPPESSSRPAEDDSSSSSETTETSSESGEDDDMDAEGTSAP